MATGNTLTPAKYVSILVSVFFCIDPGNFYFTKNRKRRNFVFWYIQIAIFGKQLCNNKPNYTWTSTSKDITCFSGRRRFIDCRGSVSIHFNEPTCRAFYTGDIQRRNFWSAFINFTRTRILRATGVCFCGCAGCNISGLCSGKTMRNNWAVRFAVDRCYDRSFLFSPYHVDDDLHWFIFSHRSFLAAW